MHHNCERISGPRWATAADPRITRVGKLLRKSHIDELPQLWNVILGDMSLVGPRPERPELIPELERQIPGYIERLRGRPGMTGLAQLQLPADTDLDSVRRKLACDLYYLDHCTLRGDLAILLGTACYLVGISIVLICRCLSIPRAQDLAEGRQHLPPETVDRRQRLTFNPQDVDPEPLASPAQ
jgi:lipopolysaccharide/colanic/teichoic acid biosynthesis glycosyltransferase